LDAGHATASDATGWRETSAVVAPLEEDGTPRMSDTSQTRNWCTAIFAAVILLTTIPAALADPQGRRPYSAEYACTVDLGLHGWTADYAACVRSLDGALSAKGRVHGPYSTERQACIDVGLDPSSQAVDQCADNLRATLWNQGILGGD
jgi:hypothetical protein